MKGNLLRHAVAAIVLAGASLVVASCGVNWLGIFGPTDVVVRSDDPVVVHDFTFEGTLADSVGDAVVSYATTDIVYAADSTGGSAFALTLADPPDAILAGENSSYVYGVQYEFPSPGTGLTLALWIESQTSFEFISEALTLILSTEPADIVTYSELESGIWVYAFDRSVDILRAVIGYATIDDGDGQRSSIWVDAQAGEAIDGEAPIDAITDLTHVVFTIDDQGNGSLYLNGERVSADSTQIALARASTSYLTLIPAVAVYEIGGNSRARVLQTQIHSEALTPSEVRALYGEGAR